MKNNHIIGITPAIDNPDYKLMKELGIKWVRLELGFPFGEKRGEYSEKFLKNLEEIRKYKEEGFEVLGSSLGPGSMRYDTEVGKTIWVSGVSEWMGSPESDIFYELLEEGCEEAARLTKGIFDIWQIANEPDIDIFRGLWSDEQNIRFLLTAANGVKKGNPEAKIGINLGFITDYSRWLLKQLYTIEDTPFDYLGIDGYFGSWQPGGPESWTSYIDEVYEITGKPIIINEWGYSSIGSTPKLYDIELKEHYNQDVCKNKAWDNVWKKEHSLEEQAQYVKKCLKIFAEHPAVIGNFFFRWSDTETCWQCGESDCPAECAWGIVDSKQIPKPAFYVLKETINELFNEVTVIHESYPIAEITIKPEFGAKIQSTMKLLAESTMKNSNTVKIIFYGQSITKQDWTKEIARYLRKSFPYANLIIKNLAIGGFDASRLVRTYEQDVIPFYPDLVIFHVYGDEKKYEKIIVGIKSNTTAEILIHSDHLRAPKAEDVEYQDSRSSIWMPRLAEKYNCEFVSVREPWKKYLRVNNLKVDDLLIDNSHLNEYGDFLMAELIKPHLRYIKEQPEDLGKSMVMTYEAGKDVHWENGKLTIPFKGNRVDVVLDDHIEFSSEILVDGKKPSQFPECYTITRPNDYPDRNWAADGKDWPWEMGAVTKVTWNELPLIEDWILRFTEVSEDVGYFRFEVYGSKTGFDGSGNNNEIFVSNSGRVVIEPQDWFIKEAHDFTFAVSIPVGFEVKWTVKPMFVDTFNVYKKWSDSSNHIVTLVQGLQNGSHTLELISRNVGNSPIKYVKVYKPTINRM